MVDKACANRRVQLDSQSEQTDVLDHAKKRMCCTCMGKECLKVAKEEIANLREELAL
jgi:hypothetical protein